MRCIAHPHGVDRTEGIAPVVLHQLMHARAEAFSGLRCLRRLAQLHDEKGNPMSLWTGTGHSLKSFLDNPSQYGSLRFSAIYYIRSDMSCRRLPLGADAGALPGQAATSSASSAGLSEGVPVLRERAAVAKLGMLATASRKPATPPALERRDPPLPQARLWGTTRIQ